MKKKAFLLTSIGAVFLVGISAVAISGIGQLNKLNTPVKASPTEHSFTFDTVTGSQFEDTTAHDQDVNVETGSSSPIRTRFMPRDISSLAFGRYGRFVEVHPIADENKDPYYSMSIGINNLTHFAIDMGVTKDEGTKDMYYISLNDKGGDVVKQWHSSFELDDKGNGTKVIEWNKGVSDSAVFEVYLQFEFKKDSADASLYVNSLSLTWNC